MTVEPRAALDRFIAALEAHYSAVITRRGEDDPSVDDAYDVLADAFEVYDDALGEKYAEATPFDLSEDEDDAFDDDSDDDDDDSDDDDSDDDDSDDRGDDDLDDGIELEVFDPSNTR